MYRFISIFIFIINFIINFIPTKPNETFSMFRQPLIHRNSSVNNNPCIRNVPFNALQEVIPDI
jgi:hypothetical protein